MPRACAVGLWLAAASVRAEVPPDSAASDAPARSYSGVFSVYIDNDVFLKSDDGYTSGVGLRWTSAAADSAGPKALVNGVAGALSFLPTVGAARYRNFVSFVLGQEIYTPTDIESPVPPSDQQPYAGLLFLDTSVFSLRQDVMHNFTLRLGCVGPCSGAEQVQRALHEWIGSPIPRGWDFQLENEFLLNVDYEWSWRVYRRCESRRAHYDLTWNVDGAFGNYYIGASTGVVGRLGYKLPDSYGVASLRIGGTPEFVGLDPPAGRRWQYYFFIGLRIFAVGRFLPTDGNTFVGGPRVDRDDVFGNLTSGFVLARARWKLSWALNNVAGLTDFRDSRANDFGTLSFSYFF